MVEINKLLCESRIFSLKHKMHSLVMDGATAQLNLQICVDGLRDDLIFVCGNLKKNGYDFTMTLEPLLSEPASDELVQRITARLQSLQEKLGRVTPSHERPSGETLKRPAVQCVHVPVENPVPTSGPAKKRKSQTLGCGVHGSDGNVDSEVLPIKGLFAAPHVAKTAMRAPSKKRKKPESAIEKRKSLGACIAIRGQYRERGRLGIVTGCRAILPH
jgi:hypothetical protein